MKRLITLCIALCCLFTFHSFAYAEGMPTNQASQLEEKEILNNAVGIITAYMDARKDLLVTGTTTALSELAVVGIINDELTHRNFLAEKEMCLLTSAFAIDYIETLEGRILAEITEQLTFANDPLNVQTTIHIITIFYKNSYDMVVVSDGYCEDSSDFESASYVDPDDVAIMPYATGSAPCIVSVAKSQIGYLEKASNENLDSFTANPGNGNYTKYGAWYGSNGVDWCAIFVSWCANQANIPTSVIKKTAWVPDYADFYAGLNRYYLGPQYASYTYTPQVGDIILTGTSATSEDHVGIVVDVFDNKVVVVDGNWGAQVSQHTYNQNDTSIVGYGHPNYGSIAHSYVTQMNQSYHWSECTNCGHCTMQLAHRWVTSGSSTYCSVCGLSNSSIMGYWDAIVLE